MPTFQDEPEQLVIDLSNGNRDYLAGAAILLHGDSALIDERFLPPVGSTRNSDIREGITAHSQSLLEGRRIFGTGLELIVVLGLVYLCSMCCPSDVGHHTDGSQKRSHFGAEILH